LVINEPTFKFFYQNYNGGPEIVISAQDDIYSNLIHISLKDFFLYSSLKEAETNSIDESNISEMNNTDLSTKFTKNPSARNNSTSKAKITEKIKNFNNNNNQKEIAIKNLQNDPKELSLINEGNEISLYSKEEEPSNFDSENFRRIYSGDSNNLKVEEDSMLNFQVSNESHVKTINSKTNNFAFYSQGNTNSNMIGFGNTNPNNINNNLINLKISPNSVANNIAGNQFNLINNSKDDILKNKNNFTSNAPGNVNNNIILTDNKNKNAFSNVNKNFILRAGSNNNNMIINPTTSSNINPSINLTKENKK